MRAACASSCRSISIAWAGTRRTTRATKDHAAFRALSAEQQLPYVEAYYRAYTGKLTDRVQCYVSTFLPGLLGTDPSMDTVLCRTDDPRRDLRQAYAANQGFDGDSKGFITRGDLAAAIDRAQARLQKRWNEILTRLSSS